MLFSDKGNEWSGPSDISSRQEKKIGKLRINKSVNFSHFGLSSLSSFNALILLGIIYSENFSGTEASLQVSTTLIPRFHLSPGHL